jgi:TniQ
MTASRTGRLAPLPVPLRPQPGETASSYARRLAQANHLRPSYLRSVLCDPPHRTGAIRLWRLAAVSGRSVSALEHALADLSSQSRPGHRLPARRQRPAPAAPGSARTLISAWLTAEPKLTRWQIWERLLDEHNTSISYSTLATYTAGFHRRARLQTEMDDTAKRQLPSPPIHPEPASQPADNQTGPLQVSPGRRADLSGTGHQPSILAR